MFEKRDDSNLKFLLIEDMESDALLLVDHLQAEGFNFDWSRVDTEDDLRSELKKEWDMILSDYTMPAFNGIEALKVVREHDRDIPFVFISGSLGEEHAVEAMRGGAQDYLTKGNLIRLGIIIERELTDVKLRREQRESNNLVNQLSLIIKQTTDSVFITDPKGVFEYVNPAFEKLTGYRADEVIGKTPSLLKSGSHASDYYQRLWKTISSGQIFKSVTINRRKRGDLFYEEKIITPLKDKDGKVTHFVSTGRDITRRIQAESGRMQLATILEATPDLVAMLNTDGSMKYLNGSGRKLLGVSYNANPSDYVIKDFFPQYVRELLVKEIMPMAMNEGSWSGETTLRISDGREIPVSLVIVAHYDNDNVIEYLSVIARDISERKNFEAELRYRAYHDELTGLPNRAYLIDRLESSLKHARRSDTAVAMMFLDLNDFKRVNDNLGHAAGDSLLQQIAKRLRGCLRPNDIVARHGGDEFTIMVTDLEHSDCAVAIVRKLQEEFERPIRIETSEIYVTFSTGIALYPNDGEDVESLLRHADTAMYRAKNTGFNQYCFYSPEMDTHGHELLALEADLRSALSKKQFMLHYQPQIDLKTGKLAGVEALIRWQHPEKGLVSPADFIPILENSGLIVQVGEWVIEQACALHKSWRDSGIEGKRIAVNVSAIQFNDEQLLEKIQKIINLYDMPPQSLELEITENIIMRDPAGSAEMLEALHKMGVRTAIDDFGTGYSSLAYLKRFPLNQLKIDRCFINDVSAGKGDAAIIEASIFMAQKLGLEVVAEGVETQEQLDFLAAHKCDLVQGFYLSKPVPENKLVALMNYTWPMEANELKRLQG